jgi:hypothetical protein
MASLDGTTAAANGGEDVVVSSRSMSRVRGAVVPVRRALAFTSAALLAVGCELVLGDLPPARDPDGGRYDAGAAGGGGASAASGGGGASSAASGCCDCDGDGHPAPGPCGGDDCDDSDGFAFPGEPAYYIHPNRTVGFDWDCNGSLERDPELDKTISCAQMTPPCGGEQGYLVPAPPACGETAPWGGCKQQGVLCVSDIIDQSRPMACK